MADVYHLRDWKVGIIQGNTGTFGSAGSDFDDTTLAGTATTQIPVDGFAEILKNVNTRRPNRVNGKRQLWHLDATQDGKGVAPTISWNCEATKAAFPYLISGLFQRCDEAGTPNYVKIFKWPDSTAVWSASTFGYPTFADNDGYFYGFVLENPTSSAFDTAILSCVPTTATISIDSTPENNRLRFTSNWAGRITQESLSATATTAYTAPSYYDFDAMNVTINAGTTFVCYGFSITIEPGFKQIPGAGSSCDDIAMGPHKVTGYIDLLWGSETRTILMDIDDDGGGAQTMPVVFYWGANPAATDGDLVIALNCQFQTPTNIGDEERVIRLPFECVKDGTYEDIQIEIADAISRGWQT